MKVRIKPGCSHRIPDPKWKGDSSRPGTGSIGPLAKAGDVIEVTEAELESFGDKFEVFEQPKQPTRQPRRKRKPRETKPEVKPEAESEVEPEE